MLEYVLVQHLPEGEMGGPVPVPLGPAELHHDHGPVGDVLLKCGLLLLDVEPSKSGENVDLFAHVRPPLNCQAYPITKTATTLSNLQGLSSTLSFLSSGSRQ